MTPSFIPALTAKYAYTESVTISAAKFYTLLTYDYNAPTIESLLNSISLTQYSGRETGIYNRPTFLEYVEEEWPWFVPLLPLFLFILLCPCSSSSLHSQQRIRMRIQRVCRRLFLVSLLFLFCHQQFCDGTFLYTNFCFLRSVTLHFRDLEIFFRTKEFHCLPTLNSSYSHSL